MTYNWKEIARPEQLEPPGDWFIWAIIAGRRWGKTRAAAETVKEWAESGRFKNIALLGHDRFHCRVIMAAAIMDPRGDDSPAYFGAEQKIVWPNGATVQMYSASNPESLRGRKHDAAWADELETEVDAFDNLMLALRTDSKLILTNRNEASLVAQKALASADHFPVAVTRGRSTVLSSSE